MIVCLLLFYLTISYPMEVQMLLPLQKVQCDW
jgi:hypothetical protein